MHPMVNWLDLHWVTSADPGAWYCKITAGPRIGGPAVQHWPADLFIFSKGLERASARAFFRLYKRVGPEDTSRQAKILIDSEPGTC